MMYITGIPAFGVMCELDTPGRWNVTKKEFLDEEMFKLKNSDESPFKNYGIEENKMVPYHEFCTYNVANHVRAYLDLLYECKFDLLEDTFIECINNSKCREDIFMCVYGKLRNLAPFKEINEFMCKEFGNAWISYIESVNSVAEHISNRDEAVKTISKIQGD